MEIKASSRLSGLAGYAFAEIDRKVAELKAAGVQVIDFGVGDPTYPTPLRIRAAAARGLDLHAAAGYPSYVGSRRFREAVSAWMNRRFGVVVDPETEIQSTIGAKEAVFHFPQAFLDPGDVVLIPSPGYPPYRTGTIFAGGTPWFMPLVQENGFLPDFERIPREVVARARIMWLNYPNSPTGRTAPAEFLARAVEFCRGNGIILASDEAYTELYYGDRPCSMLEFGKEGVVVFQSMSKRSAMTGYRIGWVCGDAGVIHWMKKLKTNIDSGVPDFVQDAAVEALSDEGHVDEARAEYKAKRDVLTGAFASAGLDARPPEATIYLWQKAPAGMTDIEYARSLLEPGVACAVVPGSWISMPVEGGFNPGAGFVRWALCPPMELVVEAARRISLR